jgi:hypothetical protein
MKRSNDEEIWPDSEYEDDSHAAAREKKLSRRGIDKMMRGNRSVFTIRDTRRRRDRRMIDGDEG